MSWLKQLFSRRRLYDDLSQEIREHLEEKMEELVASGESREEAAAAAHREFGNVTLTKEDSRAVWGWAGVESFFADGRYGLRTMRRAPGFTAIAVLSLALGIGANTAIFSLVNTLMLHRLPVRDPEQLVELLSNYPGEPRRNGFSLPFYGHVRDGNHVFSGLLGVGNSRFSVRVEGLDPETVNGAYVVGDFFPVLGVEPELGRLIGPEENRTGDAGAAVAVVSWSYWNNRFRRDPEILGKRIIVDDAPFTIVGVAPRAFLGLQVGFKPDIWIPVAAETGIAQLSRMNSGGMGLALMGRLKPGVSIEQARAEMTVLNNWRIEQIPETNRDPLMRQLKMELEPAGAGFSLLRDEFAKPLLVLMALVGLLLLIACTNVASLLLARGASRQREMAVRVSLGAGRFRLVRQALTEALLLSVAGSLLGIFLAYFGVDALVRILTSGRRIIGMPSRIEIQAHPDIRVLLFTAGVALFAVVLFGLGPAWSAFASVPAASLRESRTVGESRFRRLFGKSLVVAQVALSLVLLSAAGLFIGYLSNLHHANLGFHRDHVLLVTLEGEHSGYDQDRLSRAYQELLGRLEAIPGVRSATLSAATPISGAGASSFAIVEGYQEKPEDRRYVSINWVAPKYFETLGTPLLAGRDFSWQDRGGPRVVIINQAMAGYYFGNRDPIGKHVALEADWKGFGADQLYEIIGVVGNANYYEIREAPPRTIYFNSFQEGRVPRHFALRTSIDPEAVTPELRRAVRELLPTVPVEGVTTLADQIDASIVNERLIALLSGWFGALGAPLAFWGKRFAASLIADLPVASVAPIVFGSAGMVVLALLAAYVPACRAARVDPIEALRHE